MTPSTTPRQVIGEFGSAPTGRVLMVDDEPHVLSACRKVFGSRWSLETSDNPMAALDLVRTGEPFAVVVSDLTMPGMNGIELLSEVKKLSPDTVRIMLTGQAELGTTIDAINHGGLFRFLVKPVSTEDLQRAIDDGLEQYRLVSTFKATQEELRKANEAKDRFISILAHDLRNPLHEIIFATEYLVEKADVVTNERRTSTIEGIQRASRRISDLLENLLTWSRLQRGTLEVHPKTVDLNTLARTEIGLIRPQALLKGVNLDIDVPDDFVLVSDSNVIATVLRNLVTNAVKYTPRDGMVVVTAEQLPDETYIRVSDSGTGIPPERLATLFSQGKSTPGTSQEKGTGLGLSLCNELVRMVGGKLAVESDPSEGSTFSIILPRK